VARASDSEEQVKEICALKLERWENPPPLFGRDQSIREAKTRHAWFFLASRPHVLTVAVDIDNKGQMQSRSNALPKVDRCYPYLISRHVARGPHHALPTFD
jgi:hypothetical protein